MTDLPEDHHRSADTGADAAAETGSVNDAGSDDDTYDDTYGGAGSGDAAASRSRSWRVAVAVAAALVVVAVVGITAAVAGDGDDGDSGDDASAGTGEPGTGDDAASEPGHGAGDTGSRAGDAADVVVAVTFGEGSVVGDPVDLDLRFLDGSGQVLATRSWREVEERIGAAPSDPSRWGGLLQPLPAGDLQLEATLQQTGGPVSCTQPFTAASGDRLVLRLEDGPLGDRSIRHGVEVPCARVEPVDEWAGGATGPAGEPYVGLVEDDAVARAESEGLTTRVVGIDGVHLVVTMDLRPDRLNLMVFDGVVVAAQLDAEAPA
jgi:hypothetical protein